MNESETKNFDNIMNACFLPSKSLDERMESLKILHRDLQEAIRHHKEYVELFKERSCNQSDLNEYCVYSNDEDYHIMGHNAAVDQYGSLIIYKRLQEKETEIQAAFKEWDLFYIVNPKMKCQR